MAEAASISPWKERQREDILPVIQKCLQVWQVLDLFPAVSLTMKNKQSCGSALISSAYSACQWECTVLMLLGSFQRAEQLGFRLVQCPVTRSHWHFWRKKKRIKTPTTLNTRSGHVSHGSLANTQKCILLSGISLTANMCSCLLVLKWYVIMNFPIEMGMS